MRIKVDRKSEVSRGYKSERARGLFNVSEVDGAEFHLECELPLEPDADWRVGVVVGSSGSGKSSIGAECVGQGFREWTGGRWGKDPILEEISGSFDEVTGVLSTVGLGSVPAWLRPFGVLSNGEKFRASCAKLIRAEKGWQDVMIDEFTSVLDRTVACTGSAAFTRAWRKKGRGRLLLLTCHHDIVDWIEPDWVFDTDKQQLWIQDAGQLGAVDVGEYKEVGRLVVKK